MAHPSKGPPPHPRPPGERHNTLPCSADYTSAQPLRRAVAACLPQTCHRKRMQKGISRYHSCTTLLQLHCSRGCARTHPWVKYTCWRGAPSFSSVSTMFTIQMKVVLSTFDMSPAYTTAMSRLLVRVAMPGAPQISGRALLLPAWTDVEIPQEMSPCR